MSEQKTWESYEGVAAYLLEQIKATFGLDKVEGKQIVQGVSGADWEIDGKAVREGDKGTILIECRRHTTSKIKQEHIAAIAYRIKDIGAVGGIVVTPIGLQEGAKTIANKEAIVTVKLSAESNMQEHVLQFLRQTFVGRHEVVQMKDSVHVKVVHVDGSTEEHSYG